MERITDIEYRSGDATDPPRDRPGVIVHVCNDSGRWGKGFVLAVSRRWKEPERRFRTWAKGEETTPCALGDVQFVAVEEGLWVANLIGQKGIRSAGGTPPVRYEAIREGLKRVAVHAREHGASVHMPRIGCGLAGGRWAEIEPILREELLSTGIAVRVYDLPEVPPARPERGVNRRSSRDG